MHFSSPHRLLPLAQSTPAVSHPPYEVRSELGAWGTYLRQCARTRPWRRTEARTASGGLLQGAARCHGRLRTWRSRLCPQLSQEDASARQRQGTPCDGCGIEMGDSDSSAREALPPMPPNKPPDPTGDDGSPAIATLKLPCWNCIKPSW